MRRRVALLAISISVVIATGPGAFGEGPQDVANDISEQVMSPFCPGVTLHDCPSDNAIALRARIAGWASQGWTRQEIMGKLVAEYGPDIRSVPPKRGALLLVWLLPALAVVIGGSVAATFARRWSRRTTLPVPPRLVGPGERSRLEEELAIVRNES